MPVAAARMRELFGSLELSLANLRQGWPRSWPGVDLVLQRCWQRLGIAVQPQSDRTARVLAWSLNVAQAVEQDGRRQRRQQQELAYHNRLHIADTLVGMTHLLLASRQVAASGPDTSHSEALCLAIMAGHDFRHPGGSNAFPGQFENLAVEALRPLMREARLHADDQATVEQCILLTDPLCVKTSHQTVVDVPFSLADIRWMTVLVQEADILASALPQTQQSLTQGLSQEWAPHNPQAAANLLLPSSRIGFLEHAALFSSPAAMALGLDVIKARQITSSKKTSSPQNCS